MWGANIARSCSNQFGLFESSCSNWFGEWMTHFKRVLMSCISNSHSSQVNPYVLVVTTGNTNAANEALMVRPVCVALQKHALPCWWMCNRLNCFKNSIIWWDGVSGRTPHFPWLLPVGVRKGIQLLNFATMWYDSFQCSWKGGWKPPDWGFPLQ